MPMKRWPPPRQLHTSVGAQVTNVGGWLYNNWFKSSVDLPYDTRIDDYNWPKLIAIQCLGYFVLHIIVRLLAPSPGKKEDFIERKKLREYYFYYF